MRERLALAGLAVASAATLAGGFIAVSGAQAKPTVVVRCGDVAGSTPSGTQDGSRVVLGIVSAPPARIQRAGTDDSAAPWTYFAKVGLGIHIGTTAVEVAVPKAWRDRVAITWGPGVGAVPALRIAACRRPGGLNGSWNGYPGGFFLKAPTACVPLKVTVGRRTETIRVGIGEACAKS
jgi:hypothetical protein